MNRTGEEYRVKMGSFDASIGHETYLTVLTVRFYVTLSLFVVGLIGNCIILNVMNDSNFSTKSRRILCSSLAVTDILLLLFYLLMSLLEMMFWKPIYSIYQVLCKIYLPTFYFVVHINSWILVFLTFERLIAVFRPFNVHDIFSALRVKGAIIILVAISLTWNGEQVYRYDLIKEGNNSVCMSVNDYNLTDFMYFKDFMSEMLVCVVPILIIVPSNIALMVKMYKNRKQRQQLGLNTARVQNNSVKFNVMIISVTSAFVIFGLPTTLYAFITNYDLSGVIDEILLTIGFCNPMVNCYLYCLSGDLFKKQVLNDIKKILDRFTRKKDNENKNSVRSVSRRVQ